MTAASVAAAAAVGEISGGEDEQPGVRIDVAGVAPTERLRVSGENLGAARRVDRQPANGGFG